MGRAEAFLPVGQILHAVQHANGQLFAANWAAAIRCHRFRGLQAELAIAMPIKMVFPLLRKEFNCACKTFGIRAF